MAQTMLLTKRLTEFLSHSTSPQLHTLLLLSPTGKLLSTSSPSSTSILRTQATLAVTLWSQYHPFNVTTSSLVASSLPSVSPAPKTDDLAAITIQLEYGIMCIRALSSGLLFVAIGASGPTPTSASQQLNSHLGSPAISSPSSPADQPTSQILLHGQGESSVTARSDAGSTRSERNLQASIWGIRRRAEEVGNALEGRLAGFELSGETR